MFKFFCKRYEYKQLRYKSNIIPDHIFLIFANIYRYSIALKLRQVIPLKASIVYHNKGFMNAIWTLVKTLNIINAFSINLIFVLFAGKSASEWASKRTNALILYVFNASEFVRKLFPYTYVLNSLASPHLTHCSFEMRWVLLHWITSNNNIWHFDLCHM